MTTVLSTFSRRLGRWTPLPIAALVLTLASCGSHASSMSSASGPTPVGGKLDMSTRAPSPDPRVGLKAGAGTTAGSAIWNLKHVSNTPPSAQFVGSTNSDLAFIGNYVIQGNYNGYEVWDVSNPAMPKLADAYFCPSSQDDVSVYGTLLFVSSESNTGRKDCGKQGTADSSASERIRGVRVFDATDITHPKYIANVQTCRGSHTHTVVDDPNDKNNIYIYISGTSAVRPTTELAGCENLGGDQQNTSLFNIEVIKVPLAHPEQSAVVGHAHIFQDEKTGAVNGLASPRGHGAPATDTGLVGRMNRVALAHHLLETHKAADSALYRTQVTGLLLGTLPPAATKADSMCFQKTFDSLKVAKVIPGDETMQSMAAGGRGAGRGGRGGGGPSPCATDVAAGGRGAGGGRGGAANPGAGFLTQCHDITVYPSVGLAGGACAGMGLLLDIHDAGNPRRIAAVQDSNFSFWHSATFSNDGSMVLFSDEWGGGGAAYCRKNDPKNWGGDAIFKIVDGKMVFQSYYKMPAPQTAFENCVAHNGSLIPIPGRTVMIQSWYQGGISMFDWTDPAHPREIGFFDRGPNDSTRLASGGFWSSYWYNGYIVGSEITRGMDIFELQPSGFISQNEIDAAKSVQFKFLNVQDQPKFVWPASFALSRSYIDQLERNKGLAAGEISAARSALSTAEKASGSARKDALTALATKLDSESGASSDRPKVQLAAQSVRDLANR